MSRYFSSLLYFSNVSNLCQAELSTDMGPVITSVKNYNNLNKTPKSESLQCRNKKQQQININRFKKSNDNGKKERKKKKKEKKGGGGGGGGLFNNLAQ